MPYLIETATKEPQRRMTSLIRYAKIRGLGKFSARTAVGRAMWQWRKDLVDSLGGESCLSAQRP